MSSFTVFITLIIIVSFLLVLVIMVKNPKGGGLSSSFGGGGQQIGGVQNTSDFLDRSTWVLATLLLVLILLSNSMVSRPDTLEDSSLLSEDASEEVFPEETLRTGGVSANLNFQLF